MLVYSISYIIMGSLENGRFGEQEVHTGPHTFDHSVLTCTRVYIYICYIFLSRGGVWCSDDKH